VFAAATREVVFSNPNVVRRVNEQFIPVALKAGLVNNPPRGLEGSLYAEIGRSKPAPQGICTVNSAGKVLAWALSFDDEANILKFLDHVVDRYKSSPDAQKAVIAERFRKFPSWKLADVKDNMRRIVVPAQHAKDDRCPAKPALQRGTLVGRIIGRPLDDNGQPVADTVRQEHYMEARFEVPVYLQEQLAAESERADGKRFKVPYAFSQALITHAFLGQLDVNPMGGVPGSQNVDRKWEFWGRQQTSDESDTIRILIEGSSNVAGSQSRGGNPSRDGRLWEHRVALRWQGYADFKNKRIVELAMVANGNERLRWGNSNLRLTKEAPVEHLMAGHPIDLDCAVRYGLFAEPCNSDEVVERATVVRERRDAVSGNRSAIRAKMQRFQARVQRFQESGGDPSEIGKLMKNFGPLMSEQKFKEAETLLDEALKLLESKRLPR
jgi:hypothetical protein